MTGVGHVVPIAITNNWPGYPVNIAGKASTNDFQCFLHLPGPYYECHLSIFEVRVLQIQCRTIKRVLTHAHSSVFSFFSDYFTCNP